MLATGYCLEGHTCNQQLVAMAGWHHLPIAGSKGVQHRMSSRSGRGLRHMGQGHPWQGAGREAGPGSCCPLPEAGTFLSFRASLGNCTIATGSSQRTVPHSLPVSVSAVSTNSQMAGGAAGLLQPSEQVSWVGRPWTENLGVVWEVLVPFMRWGSQYILYLGPQFSHLGNGHDLSAILYKALRSALALPCPWGTGTMPQSTTQTRVLRGPAMVGPHPVDSNQVTTLAARIPCLSILATIKHPWNHFHLPS